MKSSPITAGLKSRPNMTPAIAEREFARMLEETEGSEACAVADQQLLGDACRELAEAHGVARNEIARRMGVDAMRVSEIYRRASTETARDFRLAVRNKLPASRVRAIRAI